MNMSIPSLEQLLQVIKSGLGVVLLLLTVMESIITAYLDKASLLLMDGIVSLG
jgi:hypothetical protein